MEIRWGVPQRQRPTPPSQIVQPVTPSLLGQIQSYTVDAVIVQDPAIDALFYTPLEAPRFQTPRFVPRPKIVGLPSQTTSTKTYTVDAFIVSQGLTSPLRNKLPRPAPTPRPRIYQPPITALQTFSLSHTVDAVVTATLSLSHTVDAVVLVTTGLSHSVDAVVSEDVQDYFFNRALQGKTQTPRAVPRPVTVGPVKLPDVFAAWHTVDAVIIWPLEIMRPKQGEKQTPRAVARPKITAPLTTEAGVGTLTHTVDAVILVANNTRTHTVDAVVSEDVQDLFFNVPFRGRIQVPRFVPGPAIVGLPSQTTSTRSHTVDAVVSEDTQDLFFNAPLRAPRVQVPRAVARPAVKQPPTAVAGQRSHQVDAVILVANNTRTHTVDAEITGVQPQFLPYRPTPKVSSIPRYLGSRIKQPPTTAINTRTYTVDAVILVANTRTHTVDAVVTAQFTKTHTVTAVIQAQGTTRQHAVTAMIHKDGLTVQHAVTAVIFKTATRTHTVDAEIGQPFKTRTFQVDAFIYNPYPVWPQDDGVQWPQDDGTGWEQSGSSNPAWPGGSGSQWPQDNESGGW